MICHFSRLGPSITHNAIYPWGLYLCVTWTWPGVWGVLQDERCSFVLTIRADQGSDEKRVSVKKDTAGKKPAHKYGRRYVQVLGSYPWLWFKWFLEWAGFPCIVFEGFFGGGVFSKKWPPTPHCLGGRGCQPPFVYLTLLLSLSPRSFCFSKHFAWKWQSVRITHLEGLKKGYCGLGANFDSRLKWRHGLRF